MKSWREQLVLAQPLRDARLTAFRSAQAEAQQQQRDRELASYERGRRDGEQALSEQLVRQRAELLELQNGVLDSLQQSIPQLIRTTERELVALALELAQKLVAGLPVSPQLVEATVREALQQVEDSTNFTIQIHPQDLELLQRANSPLLLPNGGMERVSFQGTETISRGGCLVHTRFGTIDGRRETKVELLKKAVLG
jgi:flagellar assembly protein FliH